ncbi:MAG: hypothetical protein ACK4WD_10095 [Flavobacteriales bacterium]|jgi:hypothetical protein
MKKNLISLFLFFFLIAQNLVGQTQNMTNEDVLKLTSIGATPETIIQVINDSQPAFELNNATLLVLINAGVDYAVINAMILKTQTLKDGAVVKQQSAQPEKYYANRVKIGVGYDIGVLGLGVSLNISKNRKRPTRIDFYAGLRNLKGIKVGSQNNFVWFNERDWDFSDNTFQVDSVLSSNANTLSLFVGSIGITQYIGKNFFLSGNVGIRDWVVQVTSAPRSSEEFLLWVPNYESVRMRPVMGFNLSIGADINMAERWCLTPMIGWSQMSISRRSGINNLFYGGSSSAILGYQMEDARQQNLSFQLMLGRTF